MEQQNTTTPISRRAFVYGSCVTRDAFQLEGLPELAGYFARSPIISAFGPRVTHLPTGMRLEAIASNFQRRMVQRDIQKALPTMLSGLTDEVVIIDLIDERIRVAEIHDGLIALSAEAARAGFTGRGSVILTPTDPGFMDRWKESADLLGEALQGRHVILNKAFWATADETGCDLDEQFQVKAHNGVLSEMYRHLEKILDCSVLDHPDKLLIADSQHRWGLSPFHYIDGFYRHFVEQMQELV